jgi:nitrogen fixation-related uncharacterized protein
MTIKQILLIIAVILTLIAIGLFIWAIRDMYKFFHKQREGDK